jgi:aminopeptidase N
VSNRDFEALVAGLWTAGQEDLVAPYVARYLKDAPRVAERGQAFAQEIAFAAPRMPMALDRLQRLRDDIDTASEQTGNTVLRRGWRDTVDDYDIALRVRARAAEA